MSVATSLTHRNWFFPVFPHPAVGHPLPLPQVRESALSPRSGGIARRLSEKLCNWICRRGIRRPIVGNQQVLALNLGAPASRRLVKARNEETRRRDAGAPRPDVPVQGCRARTCVRRILTLAWKFHTRNAGLGNPAFRTGRTRLVGRVPPRGGVSIFQAAGEMCGPQRRRRNIFVESAGKQIASPVGATYYDPATMSLLRSCGCFRITFYKDAAPLVLLKSWRDSAPETKVAEPARLPCESLGFDFAPGIRAA